MIMKFLLVTHTHTHTYTHTHTPTYTHIYIIKDMYTKSTPLDIPENLKDITVLRENFYDHEIPVSHTHTYTYTHNTHTHTPTYIHIYIL